MLKLKTILLIIFCLSCAIKTELETASIKNKPIVHEMIGKALDLKPQDALVSGDFFLTLVSYMPFPAAMWGDGLGPVNHDLILDSHKSWRLNLDQLKMLAGEFQPQYHPGFLEIAWCRQERVKPVRDQMVASVPRMVFSTPYASDFLTMWHEVSGINYKYDENLVRNSDAWDRRHTLRRDINLTTAIPTPNGSYREFDSNEALPLKDFMQKLAICLGGLALNTSDGWVFIPFKRTPESMKIVSALLAELKNDIGFNHHSEIGSLQRIGNLILPEILAELRNADSFYKLKLIEILADMPSPERDAEFFKIAQNLDSWADGWDPFDNASLTILTTLAESKYLPAIPLIKKYATGNFRSKNVSFNARIALNILGCPLPPKSQEDVVKIGPRALPILESDKAKRFFSIAYAVLEQGPFLYQYQFAAITDAGKGPVFAFNDKERRNELVVRIAEASQDEALVSVDSFYGYYAKLKYKNGRWLLTDWRLLWMQ